MKRRTFMGALGVTAVIPQTLKPRSWVADAWVTVKGIPVPTGTIRMGIAGENAGRYAVSDGQGGWIEGNTHHQAGSPVACMWDE